MIYCETKNGFFGKTITYKTLKDISPADRTKKG